MSSGVRLAGVAVVVVLVSAATTLVLDPGAPTPGPPDRETEQPRELAEALARLEDLASDLEAGMRRVDARLERLEAAGSAGARPRAVGPTNAERIERMKESFADLTDEELHRRADELRGKDVRAAAAAYLSLLERPLDAAGEAAVLVDLATVYRYFPGGSTQTLQREALERAIELAGADSEKGLEAAYVLTWTLSEQGDVRGALELAERVAASPGADEVRRGLAHWAAGLFAVKLGDSDRARREFAEVLKTKHKNLASTRSQVKARLAAMR
jgi:hypothetical protein